MKIYLMLVMILGFSALGSGQDVDLSAPSATATPTPTPVVVLVNQRSTSNGPFIAYKLIMSEETARVLATRKLDWGLENDRFSLRDSGTKLLVVVMSFPAQVRITIDGNKLSYVVRETLASALPRMNSSIAVGLINQGILGGSNQPIIIPVPRSHSGSIMLP
jgi:hypothetical protein